LVEATISLVIEYFPLYYELKCVLLICLQWNDALLAFDLYEKYVKPVLKRYEPAIDKFLEEYSQSASKIQRQAEDGLTQKVMDHLSKQKTS
jgi:hypothetical protein